MVETLSGLILLTTSNTEVQRHVLWVLTSEHCLVLTFIFQDMFDLLIELGAKMNIVNRQGLTPLTLAAKLASKEVSNYCLTDIGQV